MKKLFSLLLVCILALGMVASAMADADTWICPNCGLTHPVSEKFCSKCGTAQPTAELRQFCPECGREFQNDELFCPNDKTPRNEPSADIPVLSEEYVGQSVKLTLFKDSEKENRRPSYAGPGSNYAGSGAYKPYKQSGITAYFIESKWVFVHLSYWTVEDRYLYLPSYAFTSLKNVPTVTSLESVSGKTMEDIIPSWGPGTEYFTFDSFVAKKGIQVKVFFKENGYLYAEYTSPEGLVRMWLPEEKVVLD